MIQPLSIVANSDDFLFNSPNGYDTFVLKVTGFTVNGQSVSVPGLNSDYGLYIEGDRGRFREPIGLWSGHHLPVARSDQQ